MLDAFRRDIRAVFDRDPAARSLPEVRLCYPELHVVWFHRLAHWCWKHHLKRITHRDGKRVAYGIDLNMTDLPDPSWRLCRPWPSACTSWSAR